MLTSGRVAKLVVPLALPGALHLMSGTVFAASDDAKSDVSLMADELSLYTTPDCPARSVDQEAGHVEQSITSLRKSAEPYAVWCQEKTLYVMDQAEEFYKTIEPDVNTTISHVRDTCEFLSNPPSDFYPSVGVVGFSGILGVYLAKGCRVKRLFFPAGLMTLSASMFYPHHTASMVKVVKNQISSWTSQGRVLLDGLWRTKSSSKEE